MYKVYLRLNSRAEKTGILDIVALTVVPAVSKVRSSTGTEALLKSMATSSVTVTMVVFTGSGSESWKVDPKMEMGPPPSVNVTSMVLTSYNREKQKSYHKQYKFVFILLFNTYNTYSMPACMGYKYGLFCLVLTLGHKTNVYHLTKE